MSEFKGSPGPWSVSPVDTVNPRIDGSDGRGIAHAIQRDAHPSVGQGITHDQALANAQLIASSPVLLEALQAAIASFDEWAEDADPSSLADAKERLAWVDQARAAISLALGE